MKKVIILCLFVSVISLTGCGDDNITDRMYTESTSITLKVGESKRIEIIADLNGKHEDVELYVHSQLSHTTATKQLHEVNMDKNGNTQIKTDFLIKALTEGQETIVFKKMGGTRYSSQHLDIKVTVSK